MNEGILPCLAGLRGARAAAKIAVSTTTSTYRVISDLLIARYQATGGFIFVGFHTSVETSTSLSTWISIDLCVNGVRLSPLSPTSGPRGLFSAAFGTSARIYTGVDIIYPLGKRSDFIEVAPMLARPVGGGSPSIHGGCLSTTWILEL